MTMILALTIAVAGGIIGGVLALLFVGIWLVKKIE